VEDILIVYIAGPYRIDKAGAVVRFRAVARELWEAGFMPVDPIALSHDLGGLSSEDEFIRRDLALLERCDAAYFMDGWEKSAGAKKEMDFAIENGILVAYSLDGMVKLRNGVFVGGVDMDELSAV